MTTLEPSHSALIAKKDAKRRAKRRCQTAEQYATLLNQQQQQQQQDPESAHGYVESSSSDDDGDDGDDLPRETTLADLPREVLSYMAPFARFVERQTKYPANTHFGYFCDFLYYVGPDPFTVPTCQYYNLRDSKWVGIRSTQEGKPVVYTLTRLFSQNGLLVGSFDATLPGPTVIFDTFIMGRRCGVLVAKMRLSYEFFVAEDNLERYNFNAKLLEECRQAVAEQIPEFGIMSKNGVVRAPVIASNISIRHDNNVLLSAFLHPTAIDRYRVELAIERNTVHVRYPKDIYPFIELAHTVMQNIEKVLQLCADKHRPSRFVNVVLGPASSASKLDIKGAVPPLSTEEIEDDDYLPGVLWDKTTTPAKRMARKRVLGHLDHEVVASMQKHQYSSFDYLEDLLANTHQNIYLRGKHGFYIEVPKETPGKRNPRIAHIKCVTVDIGGYRGYLVAPAYPCVPDKPPIPLSKEMRQGSVRRGPSVTPWDRRVIYWDLRDDDFEEGESKTFVPFRAP